MKRIKKSELKAKMFEYFRELEKNGGELIVTDFGKPVLRIVPYTEKEKLASLFSDVRGKVSINRKLSMEPCGEEWGDDV